MKDRQLLYIRHGIFLPSASVYGNNVLKILFIWNILAINPRRHLAKNSLLCRIHNSCLSFLCFFLFFSICHADAVPPQVCHLANCVGLEVVSKPEDLQRGLMFRKGLEKDRGMFFVFTYDDRHPFWMKNMTFDLDMVWISQAGRIVFIGQNIPACTTDPCPVYAPDQPCRYVLELSRGYIAAHGWKVGDDLTIPSSDLKNISQHP